MNTIGAFSAIRWPVGIAFLAMACLLTPMQPLRAADDGEELTVAKALRLQESGKILPVQKIVEQVPGEIIEVDLKEADGQYAYQVEAVGDDGIKRQLTFDAATGEFLYGEVEDDSKDQDNDNDEG
jgi:Peptidase propeptide and YPEB domain